MDNYTDLILDKTIYFIHIPKTSGRAFRCNQINKLGHCFNVPKIYRSHANNGGHLGYSTEYWEVYNYPIKPNHKITIIRNPFDLLSSYYFHGDSLKPNNGYCQSGWSSVNYTHQFKSFKEFIIAYCEPNFNWHCPAFKNFLFSQLFDINHKCVANIIIKYEYLDEAINILNTKLTSPIDDKHKANISINKKKNYKEYYDEEMIELVNKKCKRELEYFNYDFNGSTKKEPLIINCKLKYDVYTDTIID